MTSELSGIQLRVIIKPNQFAGSSVACIRISDVVPSVHGYDLSGVF